MSKWTKQRKKLRKEQQERREKYYDKSVSTSLAEAQEKYKRFPCEENRLAMIAQAAIF